MLALFPIHILEFITVCLILLSAFRIFRELSLEVNNDASQYALSEPSTKPLDSNKNSLNRQTFDPTPKTETTLKLISNNDKLLPSKSLKQTTAESELTEQHQAVLKNYIGDFF